MVPMGLWGVSGALGVPSFGFFFIFLLTLNFFCLHQLLCFIIYS